MQTRSLALIASVQSRINVAAQKYREVCAALVLLTHEACIVGWDQKLKLLLVEDLRGMTASETAAEGGPSDGRRTLSWIWMVSGGTGDVNAEGKQESLRIEWCKARACAHWWQEECLLLEEEMRRVLTYFDYQDNCWRSLAAACADTDGPTTIGMLAYTLQQAALQCRFRDKCLVAWQDLPGVRATLRHKDILGHHYK
ncbi:hypothetical protein H0H81_002405 [Sphagnurus paluster]|uniref:Uncharacterized protein n=1 Tax=Sphagnurus paluster TaxID=117069 RepID=A0A9P7FQF8_9AGAR|nr:hypothetical protein H0H81_002405 [Sphagnurus paluster]